MKRIDRLQAIIIQLQSKKVVKAQEIAKRFEISLRTVYRDIRAIEEAGVPIGAEAGVGYFLIDNYSLPPIMFNANEAASIIMAGKFIPHMADKNQFDSFNSALFKIKAVLSPEFKDQLDKLENRIHVDPQLTHKKLPDSIYIQEIQKALVEQLEVNIIYRSNYNKKETQRTIEPITLLYYASNWHLIAFCQLRNEFRDFRLDRIKDLAISINNFIRESDKDFDDYLKKQKEQLVTHLIILETSIEALSSIDESKYWFGFVKQSINNKQVQLEFLNPDIKAFARWLLTLGPKYQIISPKVLQKEVRSLVTKLHLKYK